MFNSIYQATQANRETVIHHPQFDSAYQGIMNANEMNKQIGVAQNLVCIGCSGTGKSTLKNIIERAYPIYETEDRRCIPILIVDTPALPTVKNMAESVLVKLGDAMFYRGSAMEKTFRILNFLEKCDVKLIIFDELQHFIDQGNTSSPRQVSDWLKTLIDKAGISTVLMGLECSEQILAINEQLRRRFSRRIDLKAFSISNAESSSTFIGVLMKIDEVLNLPQRIDFSKDPQRLEQLYFATNGIMDYMVKLLLGAYEVAINVEVVLLNQKFSMIY